jgi:hypothetical protein
MNILSAVLAIISHLPDLPSPADQQQALRDLARRFRHRRFAGSAGRGPLLSRAWTVALAWAIARRNCVMLYYLRRLQNSARDFQSPVTLWGEAGSLRGQLVGLLETGPLAKQFNPEWRVLQSPLLHHRLLGLTAARLILVAHAVVPVVAARALAAGWVRSAADARAMEGHMHALLDAMFGCLSTDWVYVDTLADYVSWVEGEFGRP